MNISGKTILEIMNEKDKMEFIFDKDTKLDDILKTSKYLSNHGILIGLNLIPLGYKLFCRKITDLDISMADNDNKEGYIPNIILRLSEESLKRLTELKEIFIRNGFTNSRIVTISRNNNKDYSLIVEENVISKR